MCEFRLTYVRSTREPAKSGRHGRSTVHWRTSPILRAPLSHHFKPPHQTFSYTVKRLYAWDYCHHVWNGADIHTNYSSELLSDRSLQDIISRCVIVRDELKSAPSMGSSVLWLLLWLFPLSPGPDNNHPVISALLSNTLYHRWLT